MGLFSSKKVTTVGTAVARVIEDDSLPDSVLAASLRSIFQQVNTSDALIEELTHSLGVRAERMYRYGQSQYVYGLPSGKIASPSQGLEEVEAVLSRLTGYPTLVEYSRYAPPNNLHIAWHKLVRDWGYQSSDNQIVGKFAENGVPAYLKDIILVLPESQLAEIQDVALEQWGPAPTSGERPGRRQELKIVLGLLEHTAHRIDANATEPYAIVQYVWEIVDPIPGEGNRVIRNVHESEFILDLSGFDDEKDYIQARYIVEGNAAFWFYEMGSGVHPELEGLFDAPPESEGTYFPFLYFRYDKQSMADLEGTEEYQSSRRMAKILNLDYEGVIEAVHENPDIDDVEQAMMVMAVPAKSQDPMDLRYLFDFFDQAYYSQDAQYRNPAFQSLRQAFFKNLDVTRSSIVIQDARFKMALNHAGIFKQRKPGSIGTKGTHTGEYVVDRVRVFFEDQVTGETVSHVFDLPSYYYRKQITEAFYDELKVVNLRMVYHIWGSYTATGDEDEDILLVPVDRAITQRYAIPTRENLYARSLHFVFNSRVVTRVKWYQQDWFGVVIRVVGFVLAVISLGKSIPATMAALAAGAITVKQIIINILIQAFIGMVVIPLVVKLVGPEVGAILAIVAMALAMGDAIRSGSIPNAPWAEDLMKISSGLVSSSNTEIQEDLLGLKAEYEAFLNLAEKQTQLLEDAQQLLRGSDVLSPYIIMGESPQDFFNRTVHTGNIGVLAIEGVSTFVDRTLALPTFAETIGGFNYG